MGVDEEIGGTIAAEDEGGEMKNDGFTRLVTWLLMLPESVLSSMGARAVGADNGGGGVCRGGVAGEGKVGARRGGTIILEEACIGCPLIAVLGALPTFKADCKHEEKGKLCVNQTDISNGTSNLLSREAGI